MRAAGRTGLAVIIVVMQAAPISRRKLGILELRFGNLPRCDS